jgi:hypothetical protein
VQRPSPDLAVVGAQRSISIWLAWYAIGFFALVLIAFGDVLFAPFLIVVSEIIFITLRRQPKFSASTYRPPAPAQWQRPITALRWAGIAGNAWAIVTGALTLTVATLIVLVILIVMGFHRWLGVANFIVFALIVAWLSTRPLWIAPLRRALKVGAANQLGPYLATVNVATDGVEIDLRPLMFGRTPKRSYRFYVGFEELDEVRTMDGLTAQGYALSMEQYDPTFTVRAAWEIAHFGMDQKARPSLINMWGVGANLLLRSSTLLYMVGNADQFGPAAVAAWQAWRTTHPVPATPTA